MATKKHIFTYVMQQGAFVRYSPEGNVNAIIGISGIVQLDDNIEKMIPCCGNILLVSKQALGGLVI